MADQIKMVPLKRTAAERKAKEKEWKDSPMDEEYPWGTHINFEPDTVAKIPELKEVKAGDVLIMKAKVVVKKVEIRDEMGMKSERREVAVQMVDVGFDEFKDSDDFAAGFQDNTEDD